MKNLVLLFVAFALIGCGEKKEVDRNAEADAGSGINEPVEPSGPSQPKKPSEKQIQLSAIYWTDTTNQKIQRSNPDGANVEDVVDGVDSPEQIAVDSLDARRCGCRRRGASYGERRLDRRLLNRLSGSSE